MNIKMQQHFCQNCDKLQLLIGLFSCIHIKLLINVLETSNISVPHHRVHCSWNNRVCIYQQIDVNSSLTFVTICIGGVAKGVKGVLESFLQCIRCSAIFCMGFFLILQRSRQSCEGDFLS